MNEASGPSKTQAMTEEGAEPTQQARVWSDLQWTARVIKNEDDDGWAVAMYLAGEPEPALVGPWTMGRDKKNPKPLDATAFRTLVKTAQEFVRRSEQQLYAQLHKNIRVSVDGKSFLIALAILPTEEGATATLRAVDEWGEELACVPASPSFTLSADSARSWIASGFARLQ